LYWKVLCDIYCKKTGASQKDVASGRENKKVSDFFGNNYPALIAPINNLLRNDSGHLNYDEREKYTAEELMEKSNAIIALVFTAIIAYCNSIVKLFDETLNNLGISPQIN